MTSVACRTIIIGRHTDPHVSAVVEKLPQRGTVCLDAESLEGNLISWHLEGAIFRDASGRSAVVDARTSTRGWVRRLAPAGWDEGAVIGAKETASMLARLGTIGSIARDNYVEWLSPVDQTVATENKMMQYRAAINLEIDVPPAVIAADADAARAMVGNDVVVKPIGPGNFTDAEGASLVIYTQPVSDGELNQLSLLHSPFIIQRRISAAAHFRVVSVGGRSWVARLDAGEFQLDWRESEVAHGSFVAADEPELARKAVALTTGLNLGYSSQDWIRSKGCDYFVDLNPSGQWMFLPKTMSDEIAAAIAGFLSEGVH